jgi:hypothetical protein
MKPTVAIGAGMTAAVVALLGVLALAGIHGTTVARAADFPPSPPTTYYGTATGAVNGQKVIAFVIDGVNSTACGEGSVLTDSGNLVYVVDVGSDSQRAGCGKAGRSVVFYFPPTGAVGGKLSTNSASWQDPGLRNFNITIGAALTQKNYAPETSKDGLN